jgi:hypothetical protein
MTKDLKRRIEKLERKNGTFEFETKLRLLCRRVFWRDEEFALQAVKGHERVLGREIGDDGMVTWGGFQLFAKLLGILPAETNDAPMRELMEQANSSPSLGSSRTKTI